MGKRSQRARVVALCGAIGLAAAACSGGGSDEASETSESPETADTSPRVLQELWILERADAIDLDGELVDLASPLVDTVAASTGDPVELSSKVTFAPSRDFEVAMVDARENELESIDVVGGVVEDREGGRAVAIVATPEQGERTIGKNHVLRWGLPPTPAVVDGTPIVTEYAYAHIHPADGEPSGADVDPLALLAARTGAGTVASFVDDAGNSLIVTGEIGVARSSSSGSDEGVDDTDDVERVGSGAHRSRPAIRVAGFTAAESSESDESSNRDDDFRDWLERARERAEEAGEAKEAAEQVGDAVDEALDIGAGDKTLGDAARERAEGAVDELKDAAKDEAVEAINDEIADVADIPADARPTTDGIAEGLAECDAPGPACVEEILDELEEGFEESLERTLGRLGEDEDTGGGDGDGGTGSDGSGGGGSGRSSSGDGDDGSGAVGSGRGGDGPDGPDGDDAGGSGNGGDGPDGGGADGGRGSGGGTGERGGDDDGDDDSASTYGEPHLRTFDGVGYDLHVPGEFVGARAEGLEVQIRYVAIPCGCPVTVVGAAAISDGETSVSVNRSDGRLVAIDGERIDLDEQESVEAGAVRVERTRRGVEIVDRDGNVVSVYVIPHHLDVVVTPVDDRPWEGLLGNHNGDPDDEFSTSEGEDLGASPAADVISGTFAESWRITQEESRFEYEPGESTETFANAPFPLLAPDDEIRDLLADQVRRGPQAEAVCRLAGITDPDLAADCAMDFQVTGNVSFVHSVQAVERGTQGPRASSTSSAGPVRVPDAQLKEISGADLATGAGLVLVRVEHPDGRLFLSAVDVETREPRWRVTDIDPECRPAVVADVGVVAQVQGGTERLGDDRSAIVLLSLDDGSELARFVGDGDDVLTPCDAALNASGDVVVHLANQQARGFRVDREEIALLWRHDFAGPVGGHSPAVDGHFVVASFIREQGAGVALDALDVETGESSSTIAVDGRFPRSSPAAIAPVGDARLAVSTDGPDGDERDLPALTLIDGSGGSLREVWSVTYGPDDDAEVIQVVRVGDQLVGWTDRGRGRRLAGLSLDGGERVWSHVPESSDDPPGLVVGLGAETAVIGAHPDALLELVDGDDQDSRLVDLPDGFAAPQQITVIDRDTVVVSGATDDGGVYVDFVDL